MKTLHFIQVFFLLLSLIMDSRCSPNSIEMETQETDDESVKVITNLNLTFRGDYYRSNVQSHMKVVVCYVGTWSTYRTPEEGSFDVDHIDPTLCTHLIYGFAGLDNITYVMKPLDPWLDQKLQENGGGRDWFKKFNDFKKKHSHLKVLLAIGGWNEGSKKYSEMAGNSNKREVFIQSALDLIRKYGFDGLDLDWEFPADRGGHADDKRYFTILVQELRHRFDKYGLMLTSAFGPAKSTADKGYELRDLAGLLDHVHLMCYDYHGAWDGKTGHNAPLHAAHGEESIEASVNYYLQHGVPAHKLVVGLPFYGRTFLINHEEELDAVSNDLLPKDARYIAGLNQSAMSKGFQGPFTKEDGFLGYNEICKELMANRGDWTVYWDGKAQVPYIKNQNKWVSFDNPDSLEEKVKFIIRRKLKGAMIWSIDTDDFRASCGSIKNPLLRTVNYAFYRNKIPGDDIPVAPTEKPYRPTAGSQSLSPSTSYLVLLAIAFFPFFSC